MTKPRFTQQRAKSLYDPTNPESINYIPPEDIKSLDKEIEDYDKGTTQTSPDRNPSYAINKTPGIVSATAIQETVAGEYRQLTQGRIGYDFSNPSPSRPSANSLPSLDGTVWDPKGGQVARERLAVWLDDNPSPNPIEGKGGGPGRW